MPAPLIIDRPLLRRRLLRAAVHQAGRTPFLLEHAAEELAGRLSMVERQFSRAVALEDTGGRLAAALAASGRAGHVVRFDAWPAGEEGAALTAVADAEALPLRDQSVDLVASALALQFANDLPGAFAQIRRALRPDGLFIGALLGGDTLAELRLALAAAETEISGGASLRVLPFADLRDIGALLQRAGFTLPVTDRETLTVRYADAFGLYRDLRAMGVANPLAERSRRSAPRRLFAETARHYRDRFSDADGRVRATFELIWFSGWAPHESQQRPARRGSATVSLAEALKPKPRDRWRGGTAGAIVGRPERK